MLSQNQTYARLIIMLKGSFVYDVIQFFNVLIPTTLVSSRFLVFKLVYNVLSAKIHHTPPVSFVPWRHLQTTPWMTLHSFNYTHIFGHTNHKYVSLIGDVSNNNIHIYKLSYLRMSKQQIYFVQYQRVLHNDALERGEIIWRP